MAATAVSYTYRYPFASAVDTQRPSPQVRMATSLDGTSDDLFFDGKLRRPAVVRCRTGPIAAIHFRDANSRQAAWEQFRKYAYQWY
jgi:hypothetical protein